MSRYKKGDIFPLFTFDTAFQTGLSSHEVLKGKTVFWVLRYIGCTVCRYDVHKIAERYPEFTAQNAQVFVIMQSDRRHVQDNLSATDTVLPFEIITDPEQKIYDLLSVLRLSDLNRALRDHAILALVYLCRHLSSSSRPISGLYVVGSFSSGPLTL